MICPICKNEIKEDSKFCSKCGQQIPRCPTCNRVIPKKIKFCIHDGTPLGEELFGAFSDKREANGGALKNSDPNGEEKLPVETTGKESVDDIPVSTATVTATGSKEKQHHCIQCGARCPDTQILCSECQQKKADRPTEKNTRKKKRKILPWVCVVLFLGVVGVAGYFISKGMIPLDLLSKKSVETSENKSSEDQAFTNQSVVDEAEFQENTGDLTETLEQTLPDLEQTLPDIEQTTSPGVMDVTEGKREALPISMDGISNITATSYLIESEYGFVHHPSNLMDGSLTNAWVEDVSGQGEGESITIQFDEIYKVSGFNIHTGYQKSADTFAKNSRPAALLITFSDGSSMDITLQDVNEQQQVNFPHVIETSSVTLTIQSVYPGSKYEDTVISEIQLF